MHRDGSSTRYLLDARWLDQGGAGRVTENLLTGLRELEPAGDWRVWGPARVPTFLWAGAQHLANERSPAGFLTQRDIPQARRVGADVAIFVHQLRPLVKVAPVEVTVMHDTIPFRFPPARRPVSAIKAYFRRVAAISDVLATVSEFSRRSIIDDLGVAPARLITVDQPIDHASAARVRSLRACTPAENHALYIGRDAPHKNLDRTVEAFRSTRLHEAGAELVLVGVDGEGRRRLAALAAAIGCRVRFPGIVGQPELERLLATAAVLVQPSLEEGFGLPAAEAMAAGVPVAAADAGSLPEILRGTRPLFDPYDVGAITRAIDEAATATSVPDLKWPEPVDLARSILSAVALARRSQSDRSADQVWS